MSQLKCTTDKHFISTNSQQHYFHGCRIVTKIKSFCVSIQLYLSWSNINHVGRFLCISIIYLGSLVLLHKPFTLYILMLGWSQSILAGIDIVNNTLLNTAVTRIQYMEYGIHYLSSGNQCSEVVTLSDDAWFLMINNTFYGLFCCRFCNWKSVHDKCMSIVSIHVAWHNNYCWPMRVNNCDNNTMCDNADNGY